MGRWINHSPPTFCRGEHGPVRRDRRPLSQPTFRAAGRVGSSARLAYLANRSFANIEYGGLPILERDAR